MSLSDWQRNGWLMPHQTSPQEIADLLAIVDRDLHNSQVDDLSPDWQLNIAYNAALQAAKAALAAHGYQVTKGGMAHYHTLQSLVLTIGLTASDARKLDVFRKRRNTTEYDQAGITSAADADEMRALATTIRASLVAWLRSNRPNLHP